MEDKVTNILSIDAGGVKGIYSLVLIDGLSEKFQIDFNKDYQHYVGTSIGSVIAAALAYGITSKELLKNFARLEKDLLKGHGHLTGKLFHLIDTLFGKNQLSEIKPELFVPVFNYSKKSLSFFSNNSHPGELIADVLKAACSDIRIVKAHDVSKNGILYYDAGFFAYDPILFYVQSKNIELNSSIKILSIGCGLLENATTDLNMGDSLDIIYDSFLFTQFETTKYFFSKMNKATGVIYRRISEFPMNSPNTITIDYLVRLAQLRLNLLNREVI